VSSSIRMKRTCTVAACAALYFTLTGAAAVGDDQPQWGQRHSRNMVSSETDLPGDFGPEGRKNLKWSVPLGNQTYSTPVVARGKVLIGTNNENPRNDQHRGDRGVLMCLDEKDGHLLWQLVVPKAGRFEDWPRVGIVSPATVEGDRVYQLTNRGEIVCLDLQGMSNGNDGPFKDEAHHMTPAGEPPEQVTETDADILWLYDLHKGVGIHQHDSAYCSILQHGPFLYACTSNGVDDEHRHVPAPDAPSLVVLDKMTGRLVATDKEHIGPQIIHCTWSSPSLGKVNGRTLVFFGGGDAFCYGFEPPTEAPTDEPLGLKRVWRFDCDPSAPKKDVHLYQDDRHEGPSHISGMPVFHEDRVYLTVGGDIWHGKREAWLKCIDATRTGDIGVAGELWSYAVERHCVSTPSVHDGLVYVADCGRNVHCVDAVTGNPYWKHQTDGEIWCSTLVADDKVYVGTKRGRFWVLAAGKEKRILSETDLGGPIHGTPVAANGVLYVATMSRLYAFKRGARND
jgi:outer membrane protein assembly factor BamB